VVAGRALDVDLVLHGAVERVGERVKVTAQLVTAKEYGVQWVESYEEDFARVFAVQERIAARRHRDERGSVLHLSRRERPGARPEGKAAESNDSFQFIFLKVDPAFEDLHADPRFRELVRRLNPNDSC
jgi:hypothetical protein